MMIKSFDDVAYGSERIREAISIVNDAIAKGLISANGIPVLDVALELANSDAFDELKASVK